MLVGGGGTEPSPEALHLLCEKGFLPPSLHSSLHASGSSLCMEEVTTLPLAVRDSGVTVREGVPSSQWPQTLSGRRQCCL